MPLPDSNSSSYVYPVRSLLSGNIQPARNPSEDDVADVRARRASARTDTRISYFWTKDATDAGDSKRGRKRSASDSSVTPPAPSTVASTSTAPVALKTRRRRPRSTVSPNFRHFPAEDAVPHRRRTFTALAGMGTFTPPDPLASFAPPASIADVVSPAPEPRVRQQPPPEPRARPKQVPVSDDPLPPEEVPDVPDADAADPPLPWNPSQLGLVHLPPRSHASSSANGTRRRSNVSSPHPRLCTPSRVSSRDRSISGSASVDVPASASGSDATDATDASAQFLTVRFKHVQDEHGHHVITGREGKLARCEDEPIRAPGAVQGFGVLVVVDELEDALVVRQVSENAEELLGLSPRYLFSLECFTDTLPDGQAAVLWDNIGSLAESAIDSCEEEASPHVFLLSGWGAPPASAAGVESTHVRGGRGDERRSWTCWCAVHRPSDPAGGAQNGLIIMEFELERDTLNPLYTAAEGENASYANSPPTEKDYQGSTGGSTDGSEQTLLGGGTASGRAGAPTPLVSPLVSPTAAPKSESDAMVVVVEEKKEVEKTGGDALVDGPRVKGAPVAWVPSAEEILESTTSRAKPLLALERLRRLARGEQASSASTPSVSGTGTQRPRRARRAASSTGAGGVGMMDVFAVMAQINEQLGDAPDLAAFLQVVVGVIKDLSQFHRVLVYQFDELWNGQVVAELLDWSRTHDLYRGLHFPASDIPAQARQLYAINKVRLLYNRSQNTARIVVRSKEDLKVPLNMTHCYLRAMSPIHVKYLDNMGVRASMSVSIMAFGKLWGLVTCHSYGAHGMRVSFPVRQMLRLLSQSISRNIERLSYAQRLTTRKLINTMASDNHPTGYIVSNADDLLGLFDADFGVLVIGEAAKMLGPNEHGQEILIMAEYLRLKQFTTIQVSQAVSMDYEDLKLSAGLEVVAGLLYVPLSSEGKDFICFLRKGQPRHIHWAGNPNTGNKVGSAKTVLEPRTSFATWSETVAGRCRVWTDEQLETAGVLALVYGKFIEVWRQKENALQTTRLTNLLLSNASHEVRTPLNHIINYLEMALNGPLDDETRDNLNRSHAASKSLLFTINDLLDLTRLESGNETSFNEPFDLPDAIEDATHLYRKEAQRRKIAFKMELAQSPKIVVGDAKKIRTVVQNLTANALKYTTSGTITVGCTTFGEPEGLRGPRQTAVEIVVADTGEFEQVESLEPRGVSGGGVGLGLAVVARIVEQLGGQLRVESKVDEGSQFSFLIPLTLSVEGDVMSTQSSSSTNSSLKSRHMRSRKTSVTSSLGVGEIDSLVEALTSNYMGTQPHHEVVRRGSTSPGEQYLPPLPTSPTIVPGVFGVLDSSTPVRPVKVENFAVDTPASVPPTPVAQDAFIAFPQEPQSPVEYKPPSPPAMGTVVEVQDDPAKLRVLIVEDNNINRTVLAKRLRLDGHTVVTTTNGQEGLDKITVDRAFDVILMDIQMPILDGYQATERIRIVEKSTPTLDTPRLSTRANGGHIPIFAVSASLREHRREELANYGIDGWILKPIDFKRLKVILRGVTDPAQRALDLYHADCSWEAGGWLVDPPDPSS